MNLGVQTEGCKTLAIYRDFLGGVLTPSRLRHSLGVMEVMVHLAQVYGLDSNQALTTGLLHDAAKDLTVGEQQNLISVFNLKWDIYSEMEYVCYLHGPLGACLINHKLGVTDPVILAAIAGHGFYGDGPDLRSPLSWCLRFADLLEPSRTPVPPFSASELAWYPQGRQQLSMLAYEGRLSEAAMWMTSWTNCLFQEKGFPIHPNIPLLLTELSEQISTMNSPWL